MIQDLSYLRGFACQAQGCADYADYGRHAPNCVQDEFDIALDEVDHLRAVEAAARDVLDAYDQRDDDMDWTKPAVDMILRRALTEGRHYAVLGRVIATHENRCESCGRAAHDYGLSGCVNVLLAENESLRARNEELRAFADRHGPHSCPDYVCPTCAVLER